MTSGNQWLQNGSGASPKLTWSFGTDAPLSFVAFARETNEVLAADTSGGLYLLDPSGRIISITRTHTPIRGLAWSDTGQGGVLLIGNTKLHWFTRGLEFTGQVELPDTALAVALDAHGEYVAVSLASGINLLYDGPRKALRRFESQRPFVKLEFLVEQPALVGVADYGLLGCRSFQGEVLWEEKVWANVGGLATAADGSMVLTACFAMGVQRYDETGENVGSYQVEGTPHRVACTYQPGRVAVGTLEQNLFWLDDDGNQKWSCQTPEEIAQLHCEPQGNGLICGFTSGRIVRLDWGGY